MKSSKTLSSKKKENNKHIFILSLLLLSVITICSLVNKKEVKIEKKELIYFTGEKLSTNYAANLLDRIEEQNAIYSPYNLKKSAFLFNEISKDKTQEEIQNFLKNETDFELKINPKYKLNKTYESLYLSYIETLKKEEYFNKSINTLRSLKKEEKERLLVLINQVNMSYQSMIGEQNYSEKSIKNYKITKEDEEKNAIHLKSMLNKIEDTFETFEIKNEIKNINYLYYNEDIYTKKELNTTLIKKIEKEYKQKIKPFKKEGNTINDEIKEETNETIKYIIDDIDIEDKKLLSINTLYFNANWDQNIEKKKIQYIEFENNKKEKEIAEMMYDYLDGYYENEKAKAFKKYFADHEYSFIGILPKENTFQASHLDLESLLENKIEEKILVGIPKFTITSEIDCKKLLEEDIKELFTNQASILLSSKEMFIEEMKQKITLTIAEKGTISSKITSVDLETNSLENNIKEIILNRPFYFLIRSDKTEEILFIGKIETLKND